MSPSPHTTSVETDPELQLRLRSKRPAVDSQVERSKRSSAGELSIVPWSAPSGEQRNLEVDEEMQSKKQCISERESPMLEENDEILWCERLDSEEELNDENEANDDHEVAEMEQMVQRAARKGNERGANVYEKSLIWAADIEWKKLYEKGAVRILSGDSAEKAKTQFGDRFTPSRHVVTRPNPGEFKARWCLRGYLDPDVMELVGSGSTQSPTVSQLGRMLSCQMIVSNGWNLRLGDIRGAFLEDSLDRKKGPVYSSVPPGGIPGVPDDAVMFILGNIYGLNDAPQRWWKKFDAVMSSIGFSRSTFDVCVYSLRGTAGNLEGILCVHVDDTI